LLALLKVKISRISTYNKKITSDPDIMKMLSNVKDPKQLESQKELLLIKETKRHISEQLIRICLPDGFAEFFEHAQSLDYYDRPDYDFLIKVLERAKDSIPFYAKMKNTTLVDNELFENDPLFVRYSEAYIKHREKKIKEQKQAYISLHDQHTSAKVVTKLSDGDLSSYYLVRNQSKNKKQQAKEASPQQQAPPLQYYEQEEPTVPDDDQPTVLPHPSVIGGIQKINQRILKNLQKLHHQNSHPV